MHATSAQAGPALKWGQLPQSAQEALVPSFMAGERSAEGGPGVNGCYGPLDPLEGYQFPSGFGEMSEMDDNEFISNLFQGGIGDIGAVLPSSAGPPSSNGNVHSSHNHNGAGPSPSESKPLTRSDVAPALQLASPLSSANGITLPRQQQPPAENLDREAFEQMVDIKAGGLMRWEVMGSGASGRDLSTSGNSNKVLEHEGVNVATPWLHASNWVPNSKVENGHPAQVAQLIRSSTGITTGNAEEDSISGLIEHLPASFYAPAHSRTADEAAAHGTHLQHQLQQHQQGSLSAHDTTTATDVDTSKQTRAAKVERYKQKRKMRQFNKTVRYEARKQNAERRPRVKGRFVKQVKLPENGDGKELTVDA